MPSRPGDTDDTWLRNARLPGGRAVDLRLRGARIAAIEPAGSAPAAAGTDLGGGWLAPAPIDSHVHLALYPRAAAHRCGGIAAAVDLGAPVSFLRRHPRVLQGLRLRVAGPLLTAAGGYPTRGWGRGGYGLECADAACIRTAVHALAQAGAGAIKVALHGAQGLDDDRLRAAVDAAGEVGLPVVAHALGARDVQRAAAAGVQVLAHVPLEPLTPGQAAAWQGRYVISTLAAFGGRPAALANLRRLVAAGAIPLYGTDLGNWRQTGVSAEEIGLLRRAGLDAAQVLHAATQAPAELWGFGALGRIAPGQGASLLLLTADPLRDASALARPLAVWHRGARLHDCPAAQHNGG